MKCYEMCQKLEAPCKEKECRCWMEYEDDLNCAVVAVKKNGKLTLREVGERLSISFVRVKQIQDRALQKLRKKMQNIN
jgi:DNA-directed RNA polymerase sigma subunit (sigma70/sigma32)